MLGPVRSGLSLSEVYEEDSAPSPRPQWPVRLSTSRYRLRGAPSSHLRSPRCRDGVWRCSPQHLAWTGRRPRGRC